MYIDFCHNLAWSNSNHVWQTTEPDQLGRYVQKFVINTGIGGGVANGQLCGNKSSESGCLMQDFCTANQQQTPDACETNPYSAIDFYPLAIWTGT